MRSVVDVELGEALAVLDRAVAGVLELGVGPVDHRDAVAVIRRVERIGRRVDAVRSSLVGEIDEAMFYALDGHHSAKVMVRHVGRLSAVEAARRASTARALTGLPGVGGCV